MLCNLLKFDKYIFAMKHITQQQRGYSAPIRPFFFIEERERVTVGFQVIKTPLLHFAYVS